MLNYFERLTNPFPKSQPTTPPHNLLSFVIHYSQGMRWPLIALALLTGTMAVLEVMLFGFLGQLVDWLSVRDPETLLETEGSTLVWMTVVLLVIMPVLTLAHTLINHQSLLGNFPMAIRWNAHRYLLGQSMSFFQDDYAGRVATKVMQTALSTREAVLKITDVFVYVVVYFISMLGIVMNASLILMAPLFIWLCLYTAAQWYFIPKLKRVSTLQADARSTMTGRIVDSYTNISTIKLFAHTQREEDYARRGMGEFMDTVYLQMRLSTGLELCVSSLNFLLIFSISATAIYLWMHQSISIGAIAVAVALALRLNGMSHWIMWELSALFENIGTVADGRNTLSKTQSVTDMDSAQPLQVTSGAIEFRSVGFNYGGEARVIKQLDLIIKPGEKVGVVGRSGAGKSTLVNLLLRFHDVESGQIFIDGQDIASVTQDTLRANIGVVTQDTSLLHRTVRENIMYGKPTASEEAMVEAANKAHASDFITGLADPHGNHGYDAQVGERGVKLSGGQRQRVAIARVLLKDAPVLVLDEATSALDSEVEAAIQQSLFALMKNKTVIAIAHRLSTIAAMDRLLVMDEGKIVEQGSHETLIQLDGIYATLWKRQTNGFIGIKPNAS